MLIINNIEKISSEKLALTVGVFDGVHKGHLHLLDTLLKEAKAIEGKSVVFSLRPHPRKVLYPLKNNVRMLNSEEEKFRLLEKAGVHYLIEYPFDLEFARTSGSDFIKNILHEKLHIQTLIVGHNHSFGCDKLTPALGLNNICNQLGIKTIQTRALKDEEEENISSTKIREALREGNPEKADSLLGYDYSIKGKVVRGNMIGRTLGFPTANVFPCEPEKIIPKRGVYASKVILRGKTYSAMSNVGLRPTVNKSDALTVEVHILDFEGDIYGETIEIFFKKYMRDEKQFHSINDLRAQIKEDKKNVLNILKRPEYKQLRYI